MCTAPDEPISPRRTASAAEAILAPVEAFTGECHAGDALLLVTRSQGEAGRLGLSILLRDEIDAGTIHALRPVGRWDLEAAVDAMARDCDVDLILYTTEARAAQARSIANTGVSVLVSVRDATTVIEAARARGLRIAQVGRARAGAPRRSAAPRKTDSPCRDCPHGSRHESAGRGFGLLAAKGA